MDSYVGESFECDSQYSQSELSFKGLKPGQEPLFSGKTCSTVAEVCPVVGSDVEPSDPRNSLTIARKVTASSASSRITEEALSSFPKGFETEIDVVRELGSLQPIDFSCIDEKSLKNMALGLKYAGINSKAEAIKLNLQIIPPSPVFHTWYALNSTTISEASADGRHLNYASRISNQATLFQSWGIPLFIVYSKHNLNESQRREMESLFSHHDNIVMLSIDDDLSGLPLYNSYKNPVVADPGISSDLGRTVDVMGKNQAFLDGIRSSVLMDFPLVIEVLEAKARSLNKLGFVSRLQGLGKQGVMYLDIDNQLLHRPPYFLGCNGRLSTVRLNNFFMFSNEDQESEFRKYLKKQKQFKDYHLPELYPENHYLSDSSDINEEQLLDLQAKAEQLLSDIMDYPEEYEVDVLCQDINFIAVNQGSIQRLSEPDYTIDRRRKGDYKFYEDVCIKNMSGLSDDLKLKVLRLGFIQQIKYLLVGNDRSYKDASRRLLI